MSQKLLNIRPAVLNVRETAAYLRVSVPTIYRLAKRGDITHTRVGGRTLRFRIEDLDKYLAAHTSREWTETPPGLFRDDKE
jgi:excisionase family DNA binding protein